MESRVYNVQILGQDDQNAMGQLEASIVCAREWSRSLLGDEAVPEGERVRAVLRLNERVFRRCVVDLHFRALHHVLVAEDGKVVGRFNLYDLVDGTAEVGYRVAERVAGRGVATAALQDLCRIAGERYGLQTLRAATSSDEQRERRLSEGAHEDRVRCHGTG